METLDYEYNLTPFYGSPLSTFLQNTLGDIICAVSCILTSILTSLIEKGIVRQIFVLKGAALLFSSLFNLSINAFMVEIPSIMDQEQRMVELANYTVKTTTAHVLVPLRFSSTASESMEEMMGLIFLREMYLCTCKMKVRKQGTKHSGIKEYEIDA